MFTFIKRWLLRLFVKSTVVKTNSKIDWGDGNKEVVKSTLRYYPSHIIYLQIDKDTHEIMQYIEFLDNGKDITTVDNDYSFYRGSHKYDEPPYDLHKVKRKDYDKKLAELNLLRSLL